MTPSFGTYTAQSAALAGSLRHTHSRLAEFAEEVAFFGGEEAEKEIIEKEYMNLVRHEEKVMARRWWYGCAEEGIVKWLWGSFGVSPISSFECLLRSVKLVVCAIPVFFRLPGLSNIDLGGRTEGLSGVNFNSFLEIVFISGFVTNRRLLLSSSGILFPFYSDWPIDSHL